MAVNMMLCKSQMDIGCIKFEFNSIKSLLTKNDSEGIGYIKNLIEHFISF